MPKTVLSEQMLHCIVEGIMTRKRSVCVQHRHNFFCIFYLWLVEYAGVEPTETQEALIHAKCLECCPVGLVEDAAIVWGLLFSLFSPGSLQIAVPAYLPSLCHEA